MNKGWDSGDAIADHPLKEVEGLFGGPSAFIHGALLRCHRRVPLPALRAARVPVTAAMRAT
jgi:hypothetical protein